VLKGINKMKIDRNGNKEFLDDGTTPNPEFDVNNMESNVNPKDTEDLINKVVEERLAKIKANLDKAYADRDAAVKKAVALEDEQKQAKMKALEAEGKHKEIAEMKLTELQEKLRIAEGRVTELSRDSTVKDALAGLEFRNERSQQMAYKDVVEQLVQDPETGAWVHKSGVSIKEFIAAFSKDEENSFLFKPKTNSGSGTGSPSGTPRLDPNKKLTQMTTQEVLALAQAGKLGNFNI
jgi:hypothetical protein